MNTHVELLNYIYQNSEMGVNTLTQLLEIIKDEKFENHISSHLKEYREIRAEAKDLLNEHGYDEKGLNSFEKMRTYLMINMQTLSDKSASHIAEMLFIGSNMGILQAVKKLNHYEQADQKIRDLMVKLKQSEENNVQELKEFL